jgi:hypothetical protein
VKYTQEVNHGTQLRPILGLLGTQHFVRVQAYKDVSAAEPAKT